MKSPCEQRERFVIQHLEGHYITVRLERTSHLATSVRFPSEEDAQRFLHGQFGPNDPESYRIRKMIITYGLEETE